MPPNTLIPQSLEKLLDPPARLLANPTKDIKKWHAVVVLPTYNERGNIRRILEEITYQELNLGGIKLSILVVDDNSPDGTAKEVENFQLTHSRVHLLLGSKHGLGVAYVRGFKYARDVLNADIVFEMDADFSHDPEFIPLFINKIILGKDFVIGSRYIEGGSIPKNWPWYRKLNSWIANQVAQKIAGIKEVKDSTSGYRAIRTELFSKINLENLGAKGYAFQINLLHEAIKQGAEVFEIPINFVDRTQGNSKMGWSDIREFLVNSLKLGLKTILPLAILFGLGSLVLSAGLLGLILVGLGLVTFKVLLIWLTLAMSTLLAVQGIFTLVWMLYAWENPEWVERHRSPEKYLSAQYSFTALLPARHEEKVIQDTIAAIAAIDYPEDKKEIIVACRIDDTQTIEKARETLAQLNKPYIKLITFDSFPINKPHSLNQGLQHATKDVVVVFDAEDQPHKDIYNIVNTILIDQRADVVQSGVQLMNYKRPWFAVLNIMEYFFWFKSALHFFATHGTIPLGGNTVFFKRTWLNKVSGWDENCLTEDADIGIRLSAVGAKTSIVYDERHATQEETPPTLEGFIKQRTRWNQGFLQIFLKGDWLSYPKLSQKIMAAYILIWPFLQAGMLLYLPVPLMMVLWIKMPILVALFADLPLYIFIIQVAVLEVGLYEFLKSYGFKYSLKAAFKIIYSIIPFQLVLGLSSVRAVVRTITSNNAWEKTAHVNAHRAQAPVLGLDPVYQPQEKSEA